LQGILGAMPKFDKAWDFAPNGFAQMELGDNLFLNFNGKIVAQ
jgi:hypothetical protein